MSMTRRELMALICWSLVVSLAPPARNLDAFARDGGDRSDSDGGDNDGRGGGDDGDDDSGNDDRDDDSGDDDDHSGRGRDGDDADDRDDRDDDNDDRDDDDKDDGDDDKDDDDSTGSKGGSSRRSPSNRTDQERARAAVQEGRVLPLKDVLRLVDERRYGTVIAVDLKRYGGRDVYRLKTRDGAGTIRNLRIDAHTGKLINFFGF